MTDDLARLAPPLAVLFDLDGTLVDTVETRIEAWLEALEEADLETTPTGSGRSSASTASASRERSPRSPARPSTTPAPRRSTAIGRDLRAHEPLAAGVAGRARTRRGDRGSRDPWSIATSSRKDQVATSVAALGLDAEPTIVDASHVEHAKPEPDLLLLAAEELGIEPARCWYVGDSTWDMAAAVAAGMVPIGVTAGAAVGADALRGSGAAVVVSSLDEIAAALRDR